MQASLANSLIAVAVVLCGCGDAPSNLVVAQVNAVGNDTAHPAIVLPNIDWIDTATPTLKEQAVSPLGKTLPASEFEIEFQVYPVGQEGRPPPPVALVSVKQISKGHEVTTSLSAVPGKVDKTTGIVNYRGVCAVPRRKGESTIEVSLHGKKVLVRSTSVE